MKNKHFYFLLVLAAFAVFCVAFMGCSTENPLCSDNFCVTGEIFPRSELAEDATFSELAVDDSVILATLVGMHAPVETLPGDSTHNLKVGASVSL